jgi:hypothetical protein
MPQLDVSRVLPGLYIGSKPMPGPHLCRAGFDALVLCAEEIQPPSALFPGVLVIHAGIRDDCDLSRSERLLALRAATEVARLVRRGQRVLVTCQQGRNRSGLVTAAAVHMLTGVSGRRAASHVQRRRQTPLGPALSNPCFVELLRRLPRNAPAGASRLLGA